MVSCDKFLFNLRNTLLSILERTEFKKAVGSNINYLLLLIYRLATYQV
jgi:hypothetical protein